MADDDRAGEPLAIELAGETQVVSRGPRRGRLLLAGALALALVVAAVLLVSRGDDAVDPDEALAAARAVVEGADGYRYEQLAETSVSTGDPDGSGFDTTTRVLLTGTVAAPDRWHLVEDLGDMGLGDDLGMPQAFESIRIGDDLYSSGFTMPGSAGPPWVASTMADEVPTAAELAELWDQTWEGMDLGSDDAFFDPYLDEMRLGLAIQSYLSDEVGDPTAVTRVVTQLSEPVVEEERADGGVVLRARLAPVPALAELDDIPPVDVVLHLDADRRPVTARFTAEAGSASADVQVTFSDWGSAPAVEAPPEAEVDRTPWIAEEDLAALDPSLLLAPTEVPAPFELAYVMVYDDSEPFGDVDVPDGTCTSLWLSYGSEAELAVPDLDDLEDVDPDATFDDFDYLDITARDPGCSVDGLFGEVDFDDEIGGLPADGGDGYWTVQVGDVHVEVATTLDDEAVGAIVASLRPTTAAALEADIAEWARGAMSGGGWFTYSLSGLGGFGAFGLFGGVPG